MVISVVLLPEEADASLLISTSTEISKLADSRVLLSEAALPHITVAQFEASAEAAAELWQGVEGLKNNVPSLVSTGLALVPGRQRDELWIELQFLKSSALLDLQSAVLQTTFASTYRVSSGKADHYRPHSTLALLDGKVSPRLDLSTYPIFNKDFKNLKLAVGLNGVNFTFADCKYV